MIDECDFIIKDYYCKQTGKYKPQRWVMYYCDVCGCKRSYLPKNKSNYCSSCQKDLFLKNKLGDNYKEEVALNEKLKNNLRTRLRVALKNNYKSGSAIEDLGCSIDDFKLHMESKFKPGMTWENHGTYNKNKETWQIDHIIAISTFNLFNREELLKACHYTNLQPLWAKDNLSKGIK